MNYALRFSFHFDFYLKFIFDLLGGWNPQIAVRLIFKAHHHHPIFNLIQFRALTFTNAVLLQFPQSRAPASYLHSLASLALAGKAFEESARKRRFELLRSSAGRNY